MLTPMAIFKKHGCQIKEDRHGANAYDDGTHGVKIYMDDSKLNEFNQIKHIAYTSEVYCLQLT
jgi:hypothetical protein